MNKGLFSSTLHNLEPRIFEEGKIELPRLKNCHTSNPHKNL